MKKSIRKNNLKNIFCYGICEDFLNILFIFNNVVILETIDYNWFCLLFKLYLYLLVFYFLLLDKEFIL